MKPIAAALVFVVASQPLVALAQARDVFGNPIRARCTALEQVSDEQDRLTRRGKRLSGEVDAFVVKAEQLRDEVGDATKALEPRRALKDRVRALAHEYRELTVTYGLLSSSLQTLRALNERVRASCPQTSAENLTTMDSNLEKLEANVKRMLTAVGGAHTPLFRILERWKALEPSTSLDYAEWAK